jgi:hypothetical protein
VKGCVSVTERKTKCVREEGEMKRRNRNKKRNRSKKGTAKGNEERFTETGVQDRKIHHK